MQLMTNAGRVNKKFTFTRHIITIYATRFSNLKLGIPSLITVYYASSNKYEILQPWNH